MLLPRHPCVLARVTLWQLLLLLLIIIISIIIIIIVTKFAEQLLKTKKM